MTDPETINTLVGELRDSAAPLLNDFNPTSIISALDALPEQVAYHFLGADINAQWSAITQRFGPNGFETFQKLTLLTLIRDFEQRASDKNYTPEIKRCFERSFSRILKSIRDRSFQSYSSPNDLLLKDLAICRQKMFPAGAQVVEPSSAFHRALLFRGGIRQFVGVARLLAESGGNWPWYQIHTHLNEREEFNPDGWDQCYVRIAGMLEKHPEIRGMWGGSWFYDPVLEDVSPRLTYLRKRPQENGAYIFFSNNDPHGGALSTSETRRALHERGEYMPKAYALIWPRMPMIAWARRFSTN